MRSPIDRFESYQGLFRGKDGLEIGGPSELFRKVLPIYEVARSLDGVNFSHETMWEGHLSEGRTFNFMDDRVGWQFICEAVALGPIADDSYDFVISSNCLEHVANPLKALSEWRRVIRPGGHLLLVLPRKESNFDRNREITSFGHLLADLENNTTEQDLTHLDEILERHEYDLDPPLSTRLLSVLTLRGRRPAMTRESMRERGLANFENRGLHHHVFDQELIAAVFRQLDFEPILRTSTVIDHISVARKT